MAHSCDLLNHPCSFHRGMFKLKAKFDADSLVYSVILNVTAAQYTGSLSGIRHPHWLVQWSRHCSHMYIPVHSPWMSCRVLIILAMTGLFLDKPHITIIVKKKNLFGGIIIWQFSPHYIVTTISIDLILWGY